MYIYTIRSYQHFCGGMGYTPSDMLIKSNWIKLVMVYGSYVRHGGHGEIVRTPRTLHLYWLFDRA